MLDAQERGAKQGLSESAINYPWSPLSQELPASFSIYLNFSCLFSAAWSLPRAMLVYRVVIKAKQNDIFNISEPEVMLKILSNKYSLARDLDCKWLHG